MPGCPDVHQSRTTLYKNVKKKQSDDTFWFRKTLDDPEVDDFEILGSKFLTAGKSTKTTDFLYPQEFMLVAVDANNSHHGPFPQERLPYNDCQTNIKFQSPNKSSIYFDGRKIEYTACYVYTRPIVSLVEEEVDDGPPVGTRSY